jgi:O-antigen ligase/polysaccharide polymerase Wzy-like membrane protein
VSRVFSGALALVPVTVLAVGVFGLAWRERGSVLAEDWLAYALGAGLLVGTVLASGAAFRPARAAVAGVAALVSLAVWTALSASWSPVPALARDEALLILFYAVVLAIPLLTLRSDGERLAATTIVVAASVTLAVATSLRLVIADHLPELYWIGRLASPVRYPGAVAAIFLVSFWPAAALAARRSLPLALRTLAFAGMVALLAGWLMTQSRAAAISLAVSAVVVFAVAPSRLRLLVPVLLAAALVLPSYDALTEPFGERESVHFADAIRDAGRWALVVSVAGVAVGFAYAIIDRSVSISARIARTAGVIAIVAGMLAATAGVAAFFVAVESPGSYLEDRWEEFKRQPPRETGASHFATLGSNRYDFWRVALDEFRAHPVAGAGARAFGSVYLRSGRTEETPQRGHSLEFDLLSETGVIGMGLLTAALLPYAGILYRRARSDLLATGVLGGAAYWFVQASGDWTWTFPAAGIPFFLLLGVGAAGGASSAPHERRIGMPAALPLGLGLAIAALLAFTPPWLSARYTARALEQSPDAAADELRWARRLDPLSIDPFLAEAELASSPREAIAPLEDAVEQEPRSLGPRYLLGLAYLDAGRRADGRRELREALRLSPQSEAVRGALRRA